MERADHLTVARKDGSAVMVTFLGTEDEGWGFADDHSWLRGHSLENDR